MLELLEKMIKMQNNIKSEKECTLLIEIKYKIKILVSFGLPLRWILLNFSQKMVLKSASNENIIASKY